MLILKTLASVCGIVENLQLKLSSAERVEESGTRFDTPLDAFNNGHISSVAFTTDGTSQGDTRHLGGVLSGSFNPLHEAHRELVSVASKTLNAPVIYELSVTNVDKPPLENNVVRDRIEQFRDVGDLVITKAPVFYEKAQLFPGCTFIIGLDTMVRLVDPKYYDGDHAKMILALNQIRAAGCDFLVAGRVSEAEFRILTEVHIPAIFQEMFREIPESEFRSDISSTEIRQAVRTT
jgi:nicotinic acid mononucleotide adenylyltransferase